MAILTNDWATLLEGEFEKPYYRMLRAFLREEYEKQTVYPDMHSIFNALHHTSYADTKVVILGQDPYHGPGQAHGLSFSVRPGVAIPPSLKNMYKELQEDVGFRIPKHGCLVPWTRQGVLLLNTVLTVREAQPNSHKGKGWEGFTDKVIRLLGHRESPLVFMLWGAHAQSKRALIPAERGHLVLEAPHPSPLSAHRGFLGCRHFSKANDFLERHGRGAVDWTLPEDPMEG